MDVLAALAYFPDQFLVPLFPLLRAGDPLELAFPLDVAELHRQVQDAAVLAQVTALHPVPYHMRHTGVSDEIVSQQRSVAEAKKRGRRGHDRSLRRYSKGGRLGEQMLRLPPRVQAHCFACHAHIGEILASLRPTLRPGRGMSIR